MQAFLSSHNLGQNYHPAITHGGYGKGDSDDILPVTPLLRVGKPLVECDRSENHSKRSTSWLVTIRS